MVTINEYHVLNLPDELICEILSRIPKEDRLMCCLVCKKFLDLLFSLTHGVFELNLKNLNSVKNLPMIMELKEISSLITHLIVTHPHESLYSSLQKIISPREKGIYE